MLEKILICDDDCAVHTHIKQVLGPEYEVTSTFNPEDAKRAVLEQQFSLLILDIQIHLRMTGSSGCHVS